MLIYLYLWLLVKSPPPLPDFHGVYLWEWCFYAFVCYCDNTKEISCVLTKSICPDRLPASHKNKINIQKNGMNLALVSAHSPQRGKIEIWECHKNLFWFIAKTNSFLCCYSLRRTETFIACHLHVLHMAYGPSEAIPEERKLLFK